MVDPLAKGKEPRFQRRTPARRVEREQPEGIRSIKSLRGGKPRRHGSKSEHRLDAPIEERILNLSGCR
ncbi:MAG: hypothetical protein ACO3IB_14970, partial [Phycisphaerales bacterium]